MADTMSDRRTARTSKMNESRCDKQRNIKQASEIAKLIRWRYEINVLVPWVS